MLYLPNLFVVYFNLLFNHHLLTPLFSLDNFWDLQMFFGLPAPTHRKVQTTHSCEKLVLCDPIPMQTSIVCLSYTSNNCLVILPSQLSPSLIQLWLLHSCIKHVCWDSRSGRLQSSQTRDHSSQLVTYSHFVNALGILPIC